MKKLSLIFAAAMLATMLIITQTGCTEKTETVSRTSYYLDTICKITIYDMDDMSEDNAAQVIADAFELCSRYEQLLSKTKEGSDIYKINHAEGQPVECDPQTIEVIKKSLEFASLSGGKFDVTIGKVTDLWNFHSDEPKLPSEQDVKSALQHVGYEQIKIDGNTVTMRDSSGQIDLGAIGKGYIGDKLSEALKEAGVTGAIIDLGGNIIAVGDKWGEPFKIGVEKPYTDMTEVIGYVTGKNMTLVTSGVYERAFTVDNREYHHILDVNTGYPVDTDVAGVTIISGLGRSRDCDALSTICLMLGRESGIELIESIDGVEAVFIGVNGDITKTSGADNFTEE